MSANLEKAIQEELRQLTEEQQRQVMAFVESLKPKSAVNGARFSFVGIARSGNGSPVRNPKLAARNPDSSGF